jgi:hypothetical protein
MDLIACPPADPPAGVDFHIAGPQYRAFSASVRARPSQNGSQTPHYLTETKGDGNAIIGAGLKCADFFLLRASRSNQDDSKVR